MTSAVSMFGHKSEFDPFLFAQVGEERNGMLLSMLSTLTRLDVDPWQKAATLTKMSTRDATLRLTSLLSSLPSDAATLLAPRTVIHLISLLPQEPLRDRRQLKKSFSVRGPLLDDRVLLPHGFRPDVRRAVCRGPPRAGFDSGRTDDAFQRSGAIAKAGTPFRRRSVTS